MQKSVEDQRLPSNNSGYDSTQTTMHEVPTPLENDRGGDRLEAESVKYNVARIVRLSSGRFALFSHYRAGALDLIAVGTIEEIADHIPSANDCAYTDTRRPSNVAKPKLTQVDLADLGL